MRFLTLRLQAKSRIELVLRGKRKIGNEKWACRCRPILHGSKLSVQAGSRRCHLTIKGGVQKLCRAGSLVLCLYLRSDATGRIPGLEGWPNSAILKVLPVRRRII